MAETPGKNCAKRASRLTLHSWVAWRLEGNEDVRSWYVSFRTVVLSPSDDARVTGIVGESRPLPDDRILHVFIAKSDDEGWLAGGRRGFGCGQATNHRPWVAHTVQMRDATSPSSRHRQVDKVANKVDQMIRVANGLVARVIGRQSASGMIKAGMDIWIVLDG